MRTMHYTRRAALGAAIGLALAGCGMMGDREAGPGSRSAAGGERITLSGSNEVPPVQTGASGSGTVSVAADGSVTANITVSGMTPTAAHIHQGAAGANGPVIVPLAKSGDNTFVAPPGAKMSDAHLSAYRAGNTYVNVHSAKNPGGEVRAQLKGR